MVRVKIDNTTTYLVKQEKIDNSVFFGPYEDVYRGNVYTDNGGNVFVVGVAKDDKSHYLPLYTAIRCLHRKPMRILASVAARKSAPTANGLKKEYNPDEDEEYLTSDSEP